jgi:uncharacterized surface protein with fasciclin (FAS1) repeats
VTDDKGNTTKITIADVNQSNGMIMVVDKVLTWKALIGAEAAFERL